MIELVKVENLAKNIAKFVQKWRNDLDLHVLQVDAVTGACHTLYSLASLPSSSTNPNSI